MPLYDQTYVSTGTFTYQLPTGTVIFGNDIFPFVHGVTGSPTPLQMQQASFLLLTSFLNSYFVSGSWSQLQGRFQPSGTAGASSADSNGGRLSLVSGTAVSANNSSGTVIWFVPYISDKLSLYNGASWVDATINSPSVPVPSIVTGTFDVFAYNSGGSVALETVNWTNDTTRATALVVQNGRLVKTGDATRRYLGTGRTTTSSGQCEDSVGKRFLWNYYNQSERVLKRVDTTSSWSVPSGTALRPWNNSTSNRVEFVIGVSEEPVYLEFLGLHSVSVGGTANVCIGLDSTTTNSADVSPASNSTSAVLTIAIAKYRGIPAAGYHYLQLLEFANSASNTLFFGLVSAFSGQGGAVGYLNG